MLWRDSIVLGEDSIVFGEDSIVFGEDYIVLGEDYIVFKQEKYGRKIWTKNMDDKYVQKYVQKSLFFLMKYLVLRCENL